jgi:hypothetical protein
VVKGEPIFPGRGKIVNIWQLMSWLRHWRAFLTLPLVLAMMLGCATPQQNPYLYTGAGLGALLGGGLGAAINNRDPWKGAAIGALLGGATGGVAGEAYGRSNPYPGYYQSGYGYYGYPGSGGYGYGTPPAGPSSGYSPPQSGGYYSQAPPPETRNRQPNPAYYY